MGEETEGGLFTLTLTLIFLGDVACVGAPVKQHAEPRIMKCILDKLRTSSGRYKLQEEGFFAAGLSTVHNNSLNAYELDAPLIQN